MDLYSSGEEVVVKTRKPYTITKQRERWTDEEHNRFLEALKLYGRAWQRIEEHIGTKTAVQIRSHAQKFFSKLEKEAIVKGSALGQALDLDIPPPRPKRKPSNPYPRKTNVGTPTSHSGAKYGKPLIAVASSNGKQAMDFETESLPEKHKDEERPTTVKENKDENCSKAFTILKEAPCSSVSAAIKSSISMSAPQTNCCILREFTPSVKNVINQDETNKSFPTAEIENQMLESDDGKHKQMTDGTCKTSKLESSSHKSVQAEKTDDLTSALTDEMQSNQNYPRHITVHVVDGNLGTSTQTPSQDVLVQDSAFQPIGGINGKPNLFTNSAASNTTGSQNNMARSSIHQSFPPCPPFSQLNHDDYQSFLNNMSSTFSSLIVSTLLQHPAAHAAASFAATFWPYANVESSADSPACSQGGFPSRQIGSPPSVAAIAAATVAAATAWWTAHGLLPLCAPLHTAFACPPASTTVVPSMNISEVPPKTEQGDITLQNPPLQDHKLDQEDSEALQAQHSGSKSTAVSSSESEESGDAKLNASSKATINLDINQPISENLNSNQVEGRKLVDRSSCGSNTTSGSEETDALEKDGKEKEDPKTPDADHLAIDPSSRRYRSISNILDSWKEVSEEGRLAFRALFSREVLPQSFSPPPDLINKDHQMDNMKGIEQNTPHQDHLDSKKCSSSCDRLQQNLPFVQNNSEEEGLLTLGLGQGKLKTRRTGFKPYKRCLVEAKENRIGTTCNQVEETGPKRIRLEGGSST
ncbi:protein LATE ELONGATED HYPOCOTYL-like isoform X1 [Vicia villosa]|uniref:protein LATE ELONGATED HYPOCOTYL-like isoform X1 n=1 Tax=Vicia villosa TaxID=3911 RepID=UPI00273C5AE0|nr:protein LATE ELONGATED HYPOCOTYL-like isoform X1 [Vicia villosa]XP_058753392.1 protein LATE ELONGATED HYPOCOTYL-like isoform X1 [Vicia villosa]XP_058753393.1 protein LATE ELONGATED HYPOCOTYL-like isoform X1 [Vicia villosa]